MSALDIQIPSTFGMFVSTSYFLFTLESLACITADTASSLHDCWASIGSDSFTLVSTLFV